MNNIVLSHPRILTFITTNHCTSSCTNCCFQCKPEKKDRLSINEMKGYIDQAKNLYPSITLIVLTGGECFTYGNNLSQLIEYATKKYDLFVRIVTNAYWANTVEAARKLLKPYVEAGLKEINISTGDEHLEYVPFQNIKNACLASVEFGLVPLVNIESREDKQFTSKDFIKDKQLRQLVFEKKIEITNGVWISFKKEDKARVNNDMHLSYPHTRCDNLFSSINIDPEHRMLACCGLTAKYSKYLDLRNLRNQPIKNLYENQFNDFLKIWLYVDGPHKILDFVSKYTENINPKLYNNLHDCQVCAIIFNNDICQYILRQHYKEVYSNIILKYNAINHR